MRRYVCWRIARRYLLLLARIPTWARQDDLRPNLRLFPAAQNYVICYYPLKDGIEIATIIHGRRDWAGDIRASATLRAEYGRR
ncbi:MAG: hypothetical protein R3C02_26355 [Planctomycetaceae bacterium]